MTNQHAHEKRVGQSAHEKHETIERHRECGEVVLAHPPGHEGYEGHPEQQIGIGPEDAALDVLDGVEHVVMIVPVDADVDEAEHVAQEHRDHRYEGREIRSVRYLHLQHHHRDDDRDHAIAERLEPALPHHG